MNRTNKSKTADEFLVEKIFFKNKGKFGNRRLKMELSRKHYTVMSLNKIKRIKKKLGLMTTIRKASKWRAAFKKGEEHKVAPNLVQRNFSPSKELVVLSTDITELRYEFGKKAYLSAIKNLRTKEIVCFKVLQSPTLELVLSGVSELLKKLQDQDVIVHSDQGTQYTSGDYRRMLIDHGVRQSMSRKGNCLDNSPIESFFGHLKDEVDLKVCKNFKEVEKMITKYMNYYNNDRPQWGLKQKTPAEAGVSTSLVL